MLHPFQCLQANVSRGSLASVFIACDDELFCVNGSSGAIESSWKDEEKDTKACIILLKLSNDGNHIVAVTGEDKAFHVFFTVNLKLQRQSKRLMPKRPSAIAFTPDDTKILCADKFGDVYILPLHAEFTETLPQIESEEKRFVPTATDLTVHSQRNRKSLEAQRRLAASGQGYNAPKKAEISHELVLGHVSMLTDIVCASSTYSRNLEESEPPSNGQVRRRYFILTADRDEHIRVSRGIPQTHVIENYCLGHKQFISKLCLIRPDLLVSGGGDDFLFVWDWIKGSIVSKIELGALFSRFTQTESRDEGTKFPMRLAVSGLWPIPEDSDEPDEVLRFVCAFEKIPALVMFTSFRRNYDNNELNWKHSVINLKGNPLDIVATASMVTISIDNTSIHNQNKIQDGTTRLQSFACKLDVESGHHISSENGAGREDHYEPVTPSFIKSEQLQRIGTLVNSKDIAQLGSVLYKTEVLRKHPNEDVET